MDFPYGHDRGLREMEGKPVDLSIEEQATIDALNAEHDRLESDYQDADELPDAFDRRSARSKRRCWPLKTGRMVSIRPTSSVRGSSSASIPKAGFLVDRGYVRPEDEAPVGDPETRRRSSSTKTKGGLGRPRLQRTVISVAGYPLSRKMTRRTTQSRCRTDSSLS